MEPLGWSSFKASVGLVAAVCAMGALAACGNARARAARDDVEMADRGLWRADPHAQASDACAGAAELAARERLNAWRLAAGAPALACLAPLGDAARAHAAYLREHRERREAPHAEVAGDAGYSGRGPGERAAAFGVVADAFWVAEGVGGHAASAWSAAGTTPAFEGAAGDAGAAALIDLHLATAFHRGLLLSPGAVRFALGLGDAASPAVLMTLTRVGTRSGLIVFPPDGATEVPPSFDAARERPSTGGARRGYPVSAHAPRRLGMDGERVLNVSAFTLARVDGDGDVEPVPAMYLAPGAASGSPADAVLVPEAPLVGGAEYEARLEAEDAGKREWRVWRFRVSEGASSPR